MKYYILHTTKRRNANWIGHILRRKCVQKHVIEGKDGRGRRRRRSRQLLNALKEQRRHWNLNVEALDSSSGEVALKEAVDLS